MLLLPLIMTVALVSDNQTALRAAPHDSAPRQAVLWEGDWLEVRGQRQGFVQVYDHRRERPGYVHAWQVRTYPVDESSAAPLRAVIDFLRAGPGHESLGIGYAALYLRVAPAPAIDVDLFAALGTFAERLGQRASAVVAGRNDATTAAYLEVAESYGVHFRSFDAGGHTRVCYDGEAQRRVLASAGAAARDRAEAGLFLTEPTCVDPAQPAVEHEAEVRWQASTLAQLLSTATNSTDDERRAALQLRRAAVLAELAYHEARHQHPAEAAAAAESAVKLVAGIDRAQLSDELEQSWQDSAVRVGATRWAAVSRASTRERNTKVTFEPGMPGQTCIVVTAPKTDPLRHCTFAVVWPASLRIAPSGNAVTLALSSLPSWTELLLLQRSNTAQGEGFEWTAQVLPPAPSDPDAASGYVELAGWSPDSAHLLLVRESRAAGSVARRRFQIVTAASLAVEREASTLANFPSFRRWQSADWVGSTLALR